MRHARKPFFLAASLAALFSSCYGTVGVVGDVDPGYYPPPAYIATTPPVYYGGYPSYWYGNRWYRREGARWRAYREEPRFLRDYRSHGPLPRAYYGRGHGHFGPPGRGGPHHR